MQVHRLAFPEEEREAVATLAGSMLDAVSQPQALTLVAEHDEELVGAIAFSPLRFTPDEGWRGYILSPLGVLPRSHGQGVGGQLIKAGLQQLQQNGVNVVLVYGDPAYYGRFGFSADAARDYLPPHELEMPFGWQAALLQGRRGQGGALQCACEGLLGDPGYW